MKKIAQAFANGVADHPLFFGRKVFGGHILMSGEDINFNASYTFEVTENGKTYIFTGIRPKRLDNGWVLFEMQQLAD